MGAGDSLRALVSQIEEAYIENLRKQVNKAAEDAWREFLPSIGEKLKEAANEAADMYYGAYTPKFYNRNESIRRLLQYETSNGGTSLLYGYESENMTPYRNGNTEGPYQKFFKEGWHGGAMSSGGMGPHTMRYRTPYQYYRWWGGVAVQSASPYEETERLISQLERAWIPDEFKRLIIAKVNAIGL